MRNIKKISTNQNFDVVRIKTESNYSILKTFIIALLILLQFIFLILSFVYIYNLFKGLITISYAVSIIFCIAILSSSRTGQIKATWILFLLICPTFGWIIFIFSNEYIMFGKNKKCYQKIFKKTNYLIPSNNINLEYLPACVKNECTFFYNTCNFQTFTNIKSEYFPNGTTMFDNLIEALRQAEKFIFLEYFIISDGVLLKRISDILFEKAQKGVDIRIIYDDMGSHGTLKHKTKINLKKHGIKLQAFNKLIPIFNLALNLRDHRKIAIIDGNIAYTGGANLSDEYINEKRTHGYWKDCGIKMQGPSVNTFTLAFLQQWEFLSKKPQNYENFLNSKTEYNNDSKNIFVPYVTGPNYNKNIARDIYENMIASATERIYIMTPYFIPDETLLSLLKNKAQSGVDVQIILPKIADKKFVYLITQNNAERLIKFGVKIKLMENSFVHSKVLLTENSCVVGSINIDQRSFYQQFESAVYTNDKEIMQNVLDDFKDTFSRTVIHIPQRKSLIVNILTYLLRLISPLM